MNIAGTLKKVANWAHNEYAGNLGKMLVHTGVIGWVLSAVAQVGAIVVNNEIPKEQKKFLIPQELADAAVNILSFYVVTSAVKNLALKLVSTGKISNPTLRKFFQEKGITKSHVGKLAFDVTKYPGFEKVADSYQSLKGGVDFIGTTVGSVLSCNIITPILRNKLAAKIQKNSIDREQQPKIVTPRGITMNEYITMTSSRSGMRI